ncbi:hypothetical protein [Streptomyces sp. 3214.6]|uniref:hypothetical protein n=1 Tax=Streptomyces sp. 3214.6 TaxID=1882757 RepID=UPI00090C97CC|nr:hypothetical protein [Streptomyces sp. 3214.6]SHI66702.1 hypothetical protein SAMN05444521_8182 [Streptomyces sp. 3214.6]
MNAATNSRITVAEYLVQRGLPADWRYGSPLGRVAAEIYRQTYRREPGTAFRFINGRFRPVMTYQPSETHILTAAWDRYGCTADRLPAPAVRTPRPTTAWAGSGDSMRWTPSRGALRNHP